MTSFLEDALEQAERAIENERFRSGLAKLESAYWNVTVADGIEEFNRIRELAERVAERTDGRLAKKARALLDLNEARRASYLEGLTRVPATVPQSAANESARLWPAIAWVIGTAVVGFVIWLVYVLTASPIFPDCGRPDDILGGKYYGGAAASGSLLTATVLGGSLWLVSGVVAWRLRRKLGFVFLGFVAVYVGGLVVLWEVSPLIWGRRYCV